jgi:alkylation response protein AidB-like acyl-CoA dehydrogenase
VSSALATAIQSPSGAPLAALSGEDMVAAGQLLDTVRARVATELAPLTGRIDRDGFYPAETLRGFGADGAYALHLGRHTSLVTRSLGLAIEAMAAIGEGSIAAAFCVWCQDTCGWYLEKTANEALRVRLQANIGSGALLGGTGLSNPMKALAGMEDFKLRAERVAGGYVVTGVLPWVSNLGDGHWFGTMFQNAADPAHRMMAMVRCGDPGVEIRQSVHFIALEGTATFSVRFRKAFIADEQMLADPLDAFPRAIRPGFTLLQTGMGIGAVAACITAMRDCDKTHHASNQYLPKRPDDFEEALAEQRATILELAATPDETAVDYLRAVLQARLAISELTLEATQAAVLHAGARGYVSSSPVNRLQREGNFVALITPSVRHLRQELARLGRT